MDKELNYAIGLDIGITSVGWAVVNLDLNRIEDLGVRIFNAAENPKDGASLALPRRLARGRRLLLRRRAYRLKRVKRLIVEKNILTKNQLDNLFKNNNICSVWEARVKGLDSKLTNEEWAKILINLCKRRGFKSNRKNEAKEKETGAIISSINKNIELMKETNSRTIGECIYKRVKESDDAYKALRNKYGEYNMCTSRGIIREEINILFEKQRSFGAEFASYEIEDMYLEIFDSQRPYSDFDKLEKFVGYCTFEKGVKRAPKKCISAEEFVLYDNINKLSILCDGEKRKLNNKERDLIVKEAYNKKEIKYSALRKLLNLDENSRFSTLTYSIDKDVSKTENTKFVSLSGYYEIKRAIEKGISKEYWNEIKNNKDMLNNIAYVLTLGKTDKEIEEQLIKRNIDKKIIESVIDISFSKFNNLSVKAINKILPFMKEGFQYNEACEKAGYDFKAIYKGEKFKKLPVIDIHEIVNPVVKRALAQSRKVVNAIIDKYDSPIRINIELARELSKNFKDRKAIEKEQKENRVEIEKIRTELKDLFGKEPTYSEVLKYRLWQMQNCECAYSQQQIGIHELFSQGYCEIDHIIPFSRCFDDSLSNKVLVLGKENQRKGNRTPFEYFGDNIERWNRFEVWVKGSHLNYKKKTNLLKKKVSKEEEREWKARNLQDTKYICKYIANYINNKLKFKESDRKQKVITINGRATSILRGYWGLTKVREDGDKHHALDAAVVAVATQGLVQKISKYSKARELRGIRESDEFIDIETGEVVNLEEYREERKELFPRPWKEFTEELKIRLSNNPRAELMNNKISTYDDEFIKTNIKPIFVSRVPFRKSKGKIFKETVYSKKAFKENKFISKVNLTDLKEKDLKNFYNYECDKVLYDSIEKRMAEFKFDAKKAFADEFRKPTKSGKLGPIVRSVKIVKDVPFKDGIDFNEGVVAKEGMVRIDVYEKDKKYFIVPVYRYHIANRIKPNKAAVASKPESEWIEMDDSYEFKFSLYKNDLIELRYEKKPGYFGYYDGFDRSNSTLKIKEHDSSDEYKGIGVKTGVLEFNKYEVNVLGKFYKVREGKR